MTFCTDVDLLHWEPNLLLDATFASQLLLSGTGNISGTTFTISSGSFTTAHVEANQVLVLGGSKIGCYPIVSVESATQLTFSALYDGLFPSEGAPTATPIGDATGITFDIRTFWPQRRIISELLMQAAGVTSEELEESPDLILNVDVLRRPCALGTLQMIYSALAAVAEEPEALNLRAELYERLYRRTLRSTKVELDENGDGEADVIRPLNILQFVRS